MNQLSGHRRTDGRPVLKPILLTLATGLVLATAGCVSTVDDSHTPAVWFGRDKFDEHFPRSVDQVYTAATIVVSRDGALLSEYIPHDTTNEVRCLKARVNNRNVWIRVESKSTSPEVTSLIVQARTADDTGDAVLANQLDTEIAIELEHLGNK
jgi:hypothetical protein